MERDRQRGEESLLVPHTKGTAALLAGVGFGEECSRQTPSVDHL